MTQDDILTNRKRKKKRGKRCCRSCAISSGEGTRSAPTAATEEGEAAGELAISSTGRRQAGEEGGSNSGGFVLPRRQHVSQKTILSRNLFYNSFYKLRDALSSVLWFKDETRTEQKIRDLK